MQIGKSFSIIGISVRTTNENGKSGKDILELWTRFISEDISKQILNKVNDTIYCVYTDYEKDHTKPYTAILACEVSNLNFIPNGMIGRRIGEGKYEKHIAKGNVTMGAVFDEWLKIWALPISRAYTVDFEVYDVRAQNPEDAEVDIFIATK